MQNLSEGVDGKQYFLEKISYHSGTRFFCYFDIIPKAGHYFFKAIPQPSFPKNLLIDISMWKSAPQFCTFFVFHFAIWAPFSHFECTHTHRSKLKYFGESLTFWTMDQMQSKTQKSKECPCKISQGESVENVHFREIVFPSLVLVALILFPKANRYLLFYGNAPAFIYPEYSYRLQLYGS